MINQQLLTYISSQQEAGVDDDTIKDNLLSAGWRQQDVDEGFQAVENDLDGGNSTTAHQEIRQEVAGKRAENNDEYREPVTAEDESGSGKAALLSSIDEETSDNDAGIKRSISEDATAVDTTDDADADTEDENDTDDLEKELDAEASGIASDQDESPSSDTDTVADSSDNTSEDADEEVEASADDDSGPQNIEDTSGNPLDSHEEMKKVVGSTPAEDAADSGPVAVRTFDRDSKEAGGPTSASADEATIDHAKVAQEKDAEELQAAASAVAAAEKARRDKDDAEKIEQVDAEQKKSHRSPASDNEKVKKGGMAQIKDDQASQNQVDGIDRKTDDGRRRFAARKQSSRKKRMSKGASSRKGGSKSSTMSIALFILALILVGAGAAYAYLTFYQTSTPAATADDVMRSLADTGTFDFRIMIESAESSGSVSDRLIFEGAIDLNPDTQTESYYTITQGNETSPPIQAVMAEVENIGTIPSIQRETLRDILLTPDFFSVGEFQTEERLGQTESADGFMTNRFSISMDPQQLVSDYATLHQAAFDSALSQEVLSNLQATVSQFDPVQGQIWLDTETNAPYQITFLGTGPAGEEMQVNLQFKNYGALSGTSPSYQPRSAEQSLTALFADESEEEPDDEDETATSSDDATESMSREAALTRQDQLRINDLQQIRVALRNYVNETGNFPNTLTALQTGQTVVLSNVPTDPETDSAYPYSISPEGDRYHLGATLQILNRSDLSGDSNFNSRGQGFENGFNGAANSCQESSAIDSPTTCYDVTGTVD